MFDTFGATFFGVFASFLLWYFGQWWLKRRHDQITIKHVVRVFNEELALNINILIDFSEIAPKMMAEGNTPLFIPSRMKLSMYNYLTSSGELRLLDINKQRWILVAGSTYESFNKFVDNTELLLATFLQPSDSLKFAKSRMGKLSEQALESAKRLNEILETLKVK